MTTLGDIGDLPLTSGAVLPAAKLAYVTYGKLAADGRNAVLLTHGYTSSHLFADGGPAASEGSWGSLVGPGAPIDTDRFFVVSSNMLGSAFGSTAPRTLGPNGRAWGPDFPALSVRDIVAAQRRLLDSLGVKHLAAVVGPSYGGFQAFQWGVDFPDFVDALVPAVTAPTRPPRGGGMDALAARLATDPNWNAGHYYEKGGILPTMTAIREDTLRGYGLEAELAPRFPDPAARAAEITRIATAWAQAFDGHSLLVLGRALEGWDVTPDFPRLRARILYVLSRTDALFPPSLAPGVMAALKAAGVTAEYEEIDSEHGHLASGTDAAKWAPALRRFMAG